MSRTIETSVNVILTFEHKDQKIYDADLTMTFPVTDLDAFEVDMVRQMLAPVEAAELDDLIKISVCYMHTGTENDSPVNLLTDAEANAAINHLIRYNAKYYFQPNQRDDYEQRIVDALGIASRTKDFV